MTAWGSVNNYYLRKLKKWFECVFVVQLASFLTFCAAYLTNCTFLLSYFQRANNEKHVKTFFIGSVLGLLLTDIKAHSLFWRAEAKYCCYLTHVDYQRPFVIRKPHKHSLF